MSLAVPLTHLAELADAEAALASHIAERDERWAREPSGLPQWTRAHVVAHLAGNARGLVNLTRWAASGTRTPMYPSPEERASEIERLSRFGWTDLQAELGDGSAELAEALGGLTEPVAERQLPLGSGAPVKVCDLASSRIREVEIHRVDLVDSYRASDWSAQFTLRTLSQLAPFFVTARDVPIATLRSVDSGSCWTVGRRGPDLVGAEAQLLAWLVGRPCESVSTSNGTKVPAAPAWA
jgi:maleylpyruvate isomerase